MPIGHITLATRDVLATSEFFAATLGWRVIRSPTNVDIPVAWLEIGPDQQLHLLHLDDFEVSPFEAEFGRHIAIRRPTAEFSELKQRLVAHGAELIAPQRDTPFERFFFRDPNGYCFEIVDADHEPA